MEAQSERRNPVFKWLGLILGGMMLLIGSYSVLVGVISAIAWGFRLPNTSLQLGLSALIGWLGWKLIEATGTEMSIRMAAKILLLLTGCMMLLGGGVCAVTNAFFSVSNGLGGYGAVSAVLLAVSCAAAVAGWFAIKFSGFRFAGQKESAEKTKYPADGESNE